MSGLIYILIIIYCAEIHGLHLLFPEVNYSPTLKDTLNLTKQEVYCHFQRRIKVYFCCQMI